MRSGSMHTKSNGTITTTNETQKYKKKGRKNTPRKVGGAFRESLEGIFSFLGDSGLDVGSLPAPF